MKQKVNKYLYGWNIYTNYGYGWDFECFYDRKLDYSFSEILEDAKQYRAAGARVKICRTRIPNPDYNK